LSFGRKSSLLCCSLNIILGIRLSIGDVFFSRQENGIAIMQRYASL
jgi:hypothetical protein